MIIGRFRLFCICLLCGIGGAIRSEFIYEPANVTVVEGETTRINCTTTLKDDVVIWIINGLQYYWSDFSDLDMYTLDLIDNSLTIDNSPRTLDGTSFQCVVNNQLLSATGYLTVLYSVTLSPSLLNVSTTVSAGIVQPLTSLITSSFTLCETPSATGPTTVYKSPNHLIVAIAAATSVGTFLFFVTSCCVLNIIISVRKSKPGRHSAISENFNMVRNELYDTVSSIKLTRSSAYNHPNHFSGAS